MNEPSTRAVIAEPVVTRWVQAPRGHLEAVLADVAGRQRRFALDGGGELVFTGGFRSRRSDAWTADARLAAAIASPPVLSGLRPAEAA